MLQQLVLKIDLPLLKQGMQGVALDVSEGSIVLSAGGEGGRGGEGYYLKVPLPNLVQKEKAKAKFNKKTNVLTVKIPEAVSAAA